jgi:hypothetical protein
LVLTFTNTAAFGRRDIPSNGALRLIHSAIVALALLRVAGAATAVYAQGLPTEPVSVGDGRFVLGAEVTATIANSDPGFFNYIDDEYSMVRNLRVGVTAEVRAARRLQFLGELRMDYLHVHPFALYARIRPWPERRFDIQAGRIPPTFGAFGRTSYGGNLLIGSPLAYQYLTSLRPDALPAVAEDLIGMRARGWLSNFPLGNQDPHSGVPLINSVRWDTGVQLHGVNGVVEWTGAVTTGSLSNPRVDDDNDGRQVAGRAVVRPNAAVAIGASAARGAFISRSVQTALAAGRDVRDGVQEALGVDAEYSAGHFLARSEVIWSQWTLPIALASDRNTALTATAYLAEARYRLLPGMHVAGRIERLGFSRLRTAAAMLPWDAPVRRFELGVGYSVIRNIMVKASWQRNFRDGGRVRDEGLGALQVVYWF